MTIDESYKFLNFISNKNQSGNITPINFNIVAKEAQLEFYNKEYKVWEATQEITDNLAPFLVHKLIQVDNDGKIFYPSDYVHVSSCGIIYNWKDNYGKNQSEPREVKERNNADFRTALNDRVAPPTLKIPIFTSYSDYIQFLPKNISRVEFDYLRKPKDPVWDYDIVNGRPKFVSRGYSITANTQLNGNPLSVPRKSQSQDFEFPENVHKQIVYAMSTLLGINLRENDFVQYSEMEKNNPTQS